MGALLGFLLPLGIGSIGVVKAFLFGAMMSATKFSSLPLFLSGSREIVAASLGIDAKIVVFACSSC